MAQSQNRLVATVKEWAEQPLFRQIAFVGVILVVTVLIGAVIGNRLATGAGAGAVAPVVAQPAVTGELIVAPKATPKDLSTPLAMGTEHSGIAVVALSEVDQVETTTGLRKAPAGSRMLAFRVGDWACETAPCKSWDTLAPRIAIGATEKPLKAKQNTYVVVVPPGTETVNLLINDAGFAQEVSLVSDDTVSGDNIALLAKKGLTKAVNLSQTFQLAEHTSIALTGANGQPTDTFIRQVTVGTAQRHFFLDGSNPRDPANCFLVITADYNYLGQTQLSALDPAEISFTAGGKTYRARDLNPDPNIALLGFEVPTAVKTGTFTIGGSLAKVSTTGVQYQSVLDTRQIQLKLS